MEANDQLLDDTIASALLALRFAEGVRRDTVGLFESMLEQVRSIILSSDIDSSWSKGRVESLVLLVGGLIEEHYLAMESRMESVLGPFALERARAAENSLGRAIDGEVVAASESSAASLVFSTEVLGGPLTEYLTDQATAARRAAARALRLAAASRLSASEIAERVTGSKTGRRMVVTDIQGNRVTLPERRGGAMDAARNYMNSLSRSAAMALEASARMMVFANNKDSVRGVAAVVTLDGRTSKICISRSGGAWNPETGKPLEFSTVKSPFPGYTPWHLNCRTTLAPVVDGPPADQPSYPEWLATKPAAFQRDVLGASRYKMWKAGKLDLHQMLDVSGRPLRLEELAKR